MSTERPIIVEGNVRSFIKNENYAMLNPSFYFDKRDKSLVIFSNLFKGMYIWLYKDSDEYKEYCLKSTEYENYDFLPSLMKLTGLEENKYKYAIFDTFNIAVFNESFVNKKIFELVDPVIVNHKIQEMLDDKWMSGYSANREDLQNEFIYKNLKESEK